MSILHELAEQSRRGKIAYQSLSPTLHFLPPSKDWAMPSFDFGTFTYHASNGQPPFISVTNTEIEAWALELQKGGFALPYERCAFIVKIPNRYTFIEVYEMMDGSIKHNSFYRKENGTGQWFWQPVEYYYFNQIEFAECKYHIDRHEWIELLDRRGVSENVILGERMDHLIVFLSVLSMERVEVPASEMDFVDSVNRGRAKANLSPIPATVSIRLNPILPSPTGRQNDPGGTRCPHERRAHIRRLKSGRIVKVRASKIHGGSDTPPTYRLTG